jgi:hypothetical protein
MTHTSQRRGLDPACPRKELCLIAMAPKDYWGKRGVKSAMAELAAKVLDHKPENFIFRDFTEITIPNLGAGQWWLEGIHRWRPQWANRLVLWILAQTRSGISAVYTDMDTVQELVKDLAGQWRARNLQKGYPVSVVLSGLEGDIQVCCREAGLKAHTYLHSLDVFGTIERLPSEDELALTTMCGHGLIAAARIKHLVERIRKGKLTARQAAEDIAKPCVCGIVNRQRAEELFLRLAAAEQSQPSPAGTDR